MTESNLAANGGLAGVTAADSAIGKIDGERGELRYRGYLITDLAAHSDFVETAHLLWRGELPTRAEHDALREALRDRREMPPVVLDTLRAVAAQQGPMDALRTAVSLLSVDDVAGADNDPDANLQRSIRITACLPTIVAAYHRLRSGAEPIAPRADLDFAANFLFMLSGAEPDAEVAKMLDTCLVLHAEHGFNASTFAGRVTAATLSDIHSVVTSAVGTLKGPLHGGANTAVMQTCCSRSTTNRPRRGVSRSRSWRGEARGSWASATVCTRSSTRAR